MAYTDIDDPSAYFQTAIWSGTGSALSVTFDGNSDMQPDMVWVKNRSTSSDHRLTDSVRGTSSHLVPNDSAAIDTSSSALTAFNSDGFSVGTEQSYSQSGSNHVGWAWKTGTAFTNDASSTGIGTIDSAGSFNNDSGFSIVSYTGTGSNGTIKHGLNIAPKMIIVKGRSFSQDWFVYHEKLGNNSFLNLNGSGASFTSSSPILNNTSPTSSVFSVGTHSHVNSSSQTYIAYCFADVKGYSKFGSYTGNGNADGTFIYTGFKPAFFLFKNSSSAGSWVLVDAKRPGFNVINDSLNTNNSNAENTATVCDFTSNGVKFRTNADHMNGSYTFIYMAFAENPFVTSTGVPATAR